MAQNTNAHLAAEKITNRLRVGIFCKLDNNEWLGGISYFRNLLNAIASYTYRTIEPVIVTGSNFRVELLENFPKVSIITTPFLNRQSIFGFARRLLRRLLKHDYLLESFLVRNHIDVITHGEWIGLHSKIKVIGWITDFQHKYLPEFFSSKQLASRFRWTNEACKYCDAIIVSSNTAARDLQLFHPGQALKARVLHFSAVTLQPEGINNIEDLRNTYKFQGHYFFLPNQFWVHKNHQVVLKALQILKQKSKSVLVLASGKADDFRAPKLFKNIIRMIDEFQIQNQIRILGVIPFKDVLSLTANSIAVINPSLFEGWSTTVEEAKSLGKQLILSNIEVHREQAPDKALYFDPHDSITLADILISAWSSFNYEADLSRVHQSILRQSERRISFAKRYEEIVRKMIPVF